MNMKIKEEDKNLNYWKNNCEEDYIKTPISVLRYITELEKAVNNSVLDDVSKSFNEEQMDNAYDKGFEDGFNKMYDNVC